MDLIFFSCCLSAPSILSALFSKADAYCSNNSSTFENPDASLPSQSSLRMTAPQEGEPLALPLRLAVAHDAAFSFYYESSLAVLESLGATLVPFSPLKDASIPEHVSGLLIGGGFPEMFASDLAANASMRRSIREAADAGLPIYAECGGYMYLLEDLVDFDGKAHPMCGVFPGRAAMTKRLQMVGYVTAKMQRDTILGPAGTELRGHEFHFSQELEREEPVRPYTFTKLRNGATYGAGQQRGNVLGSYLHIHFAGCPGAAGHFVEACRAYGKKADQ